MGSAVSLLRGTRQSVESRTLFGVGDKILWDYETRSRYRAEGLRDILFAGESCARRWWLLQCYCGGRSAFLFGKAAFSSLE